MVTFVAISRPSKSGIKVQNFSLSSMHLAQFYWRPLDLVEPLLLYSHIIRYTIWNHCMHTLTLQENYIPLIGSAKCNILSQTVAISSNKAISSSDSSDPTFSSDSASLSD